MKTVLISALAAIAATATLQAQTIGDALRAQENERFAEAGRMFRQVAAAQPTPENLFYTGRYYLLQGKPDSAKIYFDQSESAGKGKSAFGKVGAGGLALLRGDKATANAEFAEARKRSKDKNAEVLYRIGELYTVLPTTDAPNAIMALQTASALDKGRADVLVQLGDAYMIPNDGSMAGTYYDRAKALNPNYTKAYIKYGDIMIRSKNYTEALKQYKQGIGKDSGYTPAYRELAELYTMAARYHEALQAYEKYIQRTDRNENNLQQYAGYLFLNKRYADAARLVEELKARSGQSPVYYRLAAYTQFETGQTQQAEQSFNHFFTAASADTMKTPITGTDYAYKGLIALKNGRDTSAAIADIMRAVAKDSTRADAFKEVADTAFAKKNYKGAVRFYKAYTDARKSAGPNDFFKYGLAQYFARHYRDADATFAKVYQLAPNSPTPLLYRGYANQGLDPDYKGTAAREYFQEYLTFTADTSKVTPEQRKGFAKQRGVAYAYLAALAGNKLDAADADKYANLALAEDPANKNANTVKSNIPAIKAAAAGGKKSAAAPAPPTKAPAKKK